MTDSATMKAAFGLLLAPELELPGLPDATGRTAPGQQAVRIALADRALVCASFSGSSGAAVWRNVFPDGCVYTLDRGRGGDHLCTYGERASFHISADATTLLCAPADVEAAAWKRFLLDTILWTLCLIRGLQALHASAVVRDGAISFSAGQGGGKSSLAIELRERGWPLLTDDILAVDRISGHAIAYPGPSLMNLSLIGPRAQTRTKIGTRLAVFEEPEPEAWTLLDDPAPAAAPLRAIVLMRPQRTGHPGLRRLDPNVLHLLPHTIEGRGIAGFTRRRFDLFSEVVERVPVLELAVPDASSPDALADAVERDIDALAPAV